MNNESSSFSDKMYDMQRGYCIKHGTLCCSVKQVLELTDVDNIDQYLSTLETVLVRISSKNNNQLALSLFESSSSFSSSKNATNDLKKKKILTFPTFINSDSKEKNSQRDIDSSSSLFRWFRPSIISTMNNANDRETPNPQLEKHNLTMHLAATWLAKYWTFYYSSTSQTTNNVADQNHNDGKTSAGWSSWMYDKSTDLVTSLLARLDLVDGNDVQNKEDSSCFGDDCFDNFDKDQSVRLAEDDCVVAGHSIPQSTATTSTLSTPWDQDMILFNIDLIILCCQLLSSYVTSEISSSHTHEYEERGQIVEGVLGDGNITSSGFLCYRFMTNKSFVSNLKDSESCLSLFQYANRVGQKHSDQDAGCILNKMSQLSPQNIDLLAQVLVAARYASWAGENNSMIIIFSMPQSQIVKNNLSGKAVNEVFSYNVAMFQLCNTKHALEGRMEHVLIPKADECKRRAVHEKTAKKNVPLAILYMKRFKVLEAEIKRCMTIICNMEQHISCLSMARNNVQILESYNMLNNAMSTLKVNQDDVEDVMTQIQEENEQSDIIHDTICSSNYTNAKVDEEELEKDLLSLMQECTKEQKEESDLDLTKQSLEHTETKSKDSESKEKNTVKIQQTFNSRI